MGLIIVLGRTFSKNPLIGGLSNKRPRQGRKLNKNIYAYLISSQFRLFIFLIHIVNNKIPFRKIPFIKHRRVQLISLHHHLKMNPIHTNMTLNHPDMNQIPPRWSQTIPKWTQTPPRWLLTTLKLPETTPWWHQSTSKWLQTTTKWHQTTPIWAQITP